MVGSRSCWLDPDNSPPTIFSLASYWHHHIETRQIQYVVVKQVRLRNGSDFGLVPFSNFKMATHHCETGPKIQK